MDNSEKNQYVKKAITNAMLELLKDKDIAEITVSEITLKAQVGRASFYRNYRNKEDILEMYLFSIINHWKNKNETENIFPNSLLKKLFEHLIEYKEFYTLLYTKKLFHLFRDVLKEVMTAKKEPLSNAEAYAAAFVSHGIYGWIEEWLARGMQESADEIYTLLQDQSAMSK
ncbi:TetR/AcrR family transcriptional regulator [Clostridioides difficile]|uniref:TetR/AcrR family transcriptional regulator n=1 Tax=Clostridioides difficile TaxID=1496 RepID=UPI001304F07E|nr:TetR/AcrR family transcriptional regulator [Clostridioides difficile]HBG7287570.1 TetR/AcrR family transcriptional regulator [Clostridioides difficile]